jgi:thiosulfate/3-mercaptopyruvate sulfurtransferase
MPYRTIVSTDILVAHLDAWVVVDCRFDLGDEAWGREQYLASHIPGAVYASLSEDLAGERTGRNGRHPLPPVEALAATFGRLGIDRSAQVVVYDQDAGMYASRLWWSLRYLGHEAVALLDGGWAAWTREGRPTRSGDEVRAPRRFVPAVRPQMRVDVAEVERLAGSRLIDARGPERYEGRVEPIDRVAGHIPGAKNHYYRRNISEESGTLLPPEVLRAQFTTVLGGHAPEETVMYCGSGVSACHNLLAMEHAGLGGAKLYAGSWSEWSSDPRRPVEQGGGD